MFIRLYSSNKKEIIALFSMFITLMSKIYWNKGIRIFFVELVLLDIWQFVSKYFHGNLVMFFLMNKVVGK